MFQFGVVGQICCDITLSGLPGMPRLGGEIFADKVSVCAGGVFTTTAWLKALGADVTHIATLGTDPITALIESDIGRHKVDLSLCTRTEGATPELTVAMPLDGDRALVTYSKEEGLPLITSNVLANTRHLHVGGVKHLRNSEVQLSGHSISLSIGTEDLALGLEGFKQLSGIVDILFVNADEGRSLAKVDDLQQALDVLSTVFPFVVLTDGERGAFAIHNGERHYHPALATKIVDATGAGDSFVAGFLLGYRQTASIDTALKLASACGAIAVTVVGATTHIPNREALEKLLEANA